MPCRRLLSRHPLPARCRTLGISPTLSAVGVLLIGLGVLLLLLALALAFTIYADISGILGVVCLTRVYNNNGVTTSDRLG